MQEKIDEQAESVALRLTQGGRLTLRSETEPESVKPVLSEEAGGRASGLSQHCTKRKT
jgi:hypothetical protein